MSNAIHPSFFKTFKELTKEVDEQPIQIKEEVALADIAEQAGWKVLREYIGDLKEMLDKIVQTSMASGSTFEEIGQKTMVVTLTKSYLDQVIERVENAKEANQPE